MQGIIVAPSYELLMQELHNLVIAWQELDEMHVDYYHAARSTGNEGLRPIYYAAMTEVVAEKLQLDHMILEVLEMMTQAQENQND